MNFKQLFLSAFACILLISCGSSKKAASNSTNVTSRPEKRYTNLELTTMYIETYRKIAIDEMKKYGVPASITLAQGILESGRGQSKLASKSNNHFGVKCHKDWKGPKVYHDDDRKGECFRKYKHPKYSFRDHSLFLVERDRYSFLFEYKVTDYKRWAKGLKKAGYATDPKYPAKLISIIEKYELHKYDKNVKATHVKDKKLTSSGKTHVVKKGDTLYKISQKYGGIKVEAIKKLNNLKSNNLHIGQKLKIPAK
ncbi:glucosaminidase domain-containing protein [Aureivirga sp. CE67]|uniref:glucosaminidase domain-containing protein n=1 Tax=Aureivirga sp. CE67 TaxID=1788983 RepID=UPI0018CB23EA|nr:glucosaminidase domain-containing protein [Aureivirga sp. CE67]